MAYVASTFSRSWATAWEHIATFVPKFLGFIVILVVGYFIAKLLAKLFDTVLERVGFDRWVQRGGLRNVLARSKYEPSDLLGQVVFWAVMLFVLQLAFGLFGPNPISSLIRGIIAFLPNIFVAIVILVIAAALAKVVSDLLQSVLGAVSGGEFMARAAGMAILVVGLFAALNQLRIAPAIVNGIFYTILAIIAGSAIIAIGVGGVPTMRQYWQRWSQSLDEKTPQVRQQMQQQRDARRAEQQRAQATQTTYVEPTQAGSVRYVSPEEEEALLRRTRRTSTTIDLTEEEDLPTRDRGY